MAVREVRDTLKKPKEEKQQKSMKCLKCGKQQSIKKYKSTYRWCDPCRSKIETVEVLERFLKDSEMSLNSNLWNRCMDLITEKYPDLSPEEVEKRTIKDYFRQSNLPQNRNNGLEKEIGETPLNISKEILLRWGSEFDSEEDYLQLEQFYNNMKDINGIETPQDESYLKKLTLLSFQLDEALIGRRYDEAKKLGELFSKFMADSKFRAMDKTDADKTGGIRNFSSIYSEVEKDDFIPPWEHYRKLHGITQDIVDKTIMHIENFTLRLNRIERMTEPPSDTPDLEEGEY